MTNKQLLRLRLASQQLTQHQHTSVKQLVSYMGAMQSQDFAMSRWAVGLRIKNIHEQDVVDALNKGQIIRTHVLRPTWHFVAADDIVWMNQLTAPGVKALLKTNDKRLQLDEALLKKAGRSIEKLLQHHDNLTRKEITKHLAQLKIPVNENRVAHYLMHAELDNIICSGAIVNNKFTYALFEKRINKTQKLNNEEALATLAATYFQGHGPATVEDFKWWSGLSITKAKQAIQMLDKKFIQDTVGNKIYYFKDDLKASTKSSTIMLPSFDEFVISYTDRSALFTDKTHQKVISSNGIFWPVILSNGLVIGQWSRVIKNKTVDVEADVFTALSKSLTKKMATYFKNYTHFLQCKKGNFTEAAFTK